MKQILTKELLEDLYTKQKLSIKKIVELTGNSIGSIRRKIQEYELTKELTKEERIRQKGEIIISLEEIKDLYINQKLSIDTIAKKYSVSKSKVKNLLELYQIQQRTEEEKFALIHERSKETLKERHGVEYPYQIPEIRDKMREKVQSTYATGIPQEKIRQLWKETNIEHKRRETSLEKYGTEIPSQSKEVINKISQSNKRTFSSREPIRKREETNLSRYGTKNFSSSKSYKDRLPEINAKSYETRKNNNTLFIGESNREKQVANILIAEFKDLKRNYRNDSRYPFKCDFYIPSLDLFIEYNGHQYHYKEPFNNNNPEHLNRLKKLKQKEQEKKELKQKTQYTRMIKVWTTEDPLKRETAKKNNLNFKEFWSIDEVIDWLEEYKVIRQIENELGTSLNLSAINISYHSNKKTSGIQKESLQAMKKGIFLYHIFEYEWLTKKDRIISQLRNLFGKNEVKIGARKCTIKELNPEEAKEFLNKNHLQGSDRAPIRLGLFYKEELVSIMTFGKPRFNKQYEYELLRFCCKANTTVVGAASKLFKCFIEKYKPLNIISYSNIAHTEGKLYSFLGFKQISISHPNYVWTRGEQALTRYQCQRHKLIKQFPELKDLSETEIMTYLGYEKLEDAGNITWLIELSKSNT